MKRFAAFLGAAMLYVIVFGCASGPKEQDLADLEGRLQADLEKQVFALRNELTGLKEQAITVRDLKLQVQQALEALDRKTAELEKIAEGARNESIEAQKKLLTVLEAEQRVAQERMNTLKILIEELKKNTGGE
jgi:prophage DNA circulation protein